MQHRLQDLQLRRGVSPPGQTKPEDRFPEKRKRLAALQRFS